jgi:hypothetical protein
MAAASIPVGGMDPAQREQLVERIRHSLLKRMEGRSPPRATPGTLPSRRLAPAVADTGPAAGNAPPPEGPAG